MSASIRLRFAPFKPAQPTEDAVFGESGVPRLLAADRVLSRQQDLLDAAARQAATV